MVINKKTLHKNMKKISKSSKTIKYGGGPIDLLKTYFQVQAQRKAEKEQERFEELDVYPLEKIPYEYQVKLGLYNNSTSSESSDNGPDLSREDILEFLKTKKGIKTEAQLLKLLKKENIIPKSIKVPKPSNNNGRENIIKQFPKFTPYTPSNPIKSSMADTSRFSNKTNRAFIEKPPYTRPILFQKDKTTTNSSKFLTLRRGSSIMKKNPKLMHTIPERHSNPPKSKKGKQGKKTSFA